MRLALPATVLAAVALAAAAAAPPRPKEQAYRENNRGVALLEQFRHQEGAEAFRKALALDKDLKIARINLAIALLNVPDLPAAEREAKEAVAVAPQAPQAHYVAGLVARGQNQVEAARAEFRKVLALDPADVGANVNLGQIFLQERAFDEAIAAFRAALAADPHNATALYNLGLSLTRSGQSEEGQKALERFRALREAGYGTLIGQNYPEQGRYAEALISTGAEADLVDAATPAVRFLDKTAEAFPTAPASLGAGRVTLFDVDGDGDLDVFDVGATGQRLYRNDTGRFSDATAALGLKKELGGLGAAAGDLDNDQRADLLVLRDKGVTLYRNTAKGLEDATAAAGLATAGASASAALADLDHDGDLDLLLGGQASADRLMQNTGTAVFKDVAAKAGLAATARVLAVVPTDYDNGRDIDLLEVAEGGAPRLFRNLRDGAFRDVAGDAGLGSAAGLRCAAAGDANKDSYTDFFFGADKGDLLANSDGKGRFAAGRAPWGSSGSTAAQFLDYDNDGLLDLVLLSPAGTRLVRNLGSRWVDVTAAALGDAARSPATALAVGDLDGDGATDLVLRAASGGLRVWRNEGAEARGSVRVRLSGLVSNRSGVGSKVEMRAGSLHQKLETSAATPAAGPADLVFGLGGRPGADAVRVIWPSGVLQTEMAEASAHAVLDVKELDRKPSSCPFLYAWNGSAFEFVTDFMGGGEMGYSHAPGVFNQPDPLEYVRLTTEQLVPRDGRLELRVTNELEEALFVDRLALVAVTHPADVEVYPYEGMTEPPKPVRVVAIKDARPPVSAVDDHGHDVLDRLARLDRRYPDDFPLERIRGYAADHALTLDLGATADRAVLLLTGWTDYAFSTDNIAAHQAGLESRPPSLEVEDDGGRFVTALEQIGIPVGRPQTVVVDLTGAFRGRSRRVRIATSMRIYWDQVRVGTLLDAPPGAPALEAVGATLRERGFSAEVSPDGREPYGYDYARVSLASPWKAFPGRYTRAGDVSELLRQTDDVFVISRPGDEIALSFDASALPPPGPGQKRTFLLLSDGFSKEMDIHSATPDSLGPLPFHAMSRYPYAPPESYPMTEERQRLFDLYNTRVVKAPVPGVELALLHRPR